MRLARSTIAGLCLLGAGVFYPLWTHATGTPAGTSVTNQAFVEYRLWGSDLLLTSNIVSYLIDERLDLALTWQDASNIVVTPGERTAMLTFRLTNTGNYRETFNLMINNGIVVGDHFNPTTPTDIYLDTNGNGQFDAGTDQRYQQTSNQPALDADTSIYLFVFNAIPADPGGPQEGDLGICRLRANCVTGSGNPGDAFLHKGFDGTLTAVLGASGGTAAANGIYQATRTELDIRKSATIRDPSGGTQPVTGSVITYTLDVGVTGPGTARNVVIDDAIPEFTTYVPNSLTMNGLPLTDQSDSDAGEVVALPAGSANETLFVRLGDLTNTSPPHILTFKVTID